MNMPRVVIGRVQDNDHATTFPAAHTYMYPEVVTPVNGPVLARDHRSDIWSLGVVLYEMLTGLPPFAGDNLLSISRAILEQEPRPLPGSASCAQSVVGHALSKDRNQRYQSVSELLGELQTVKRAAAPGAVPRQRVVPFIAVLPFTNMSPDPENEYFSDGLTEEIIADLSKIRA